MLKRSRIWFVCLGPVGRRPGNILHILEAERSQLSAVALMHDKKRPLTDFYYPHNPRRRVRTD
jgi:hypothetical protein